MDSAEKHLLLLQTGPVQDFITAARTTSDLCSGSYLIAYLTAAGIRYVCEQGGEIIFPCLENQTVYERLCGRTKELGQPTLPNRFLAEVPADRAEEIARGAESAIRKELENISGTCFENFCNLFTESGRKYRPRWENQVNRFLQISWQTVPLDPANWDKSYARLLRNLAARRNTRNFLQYAGDDSLPELQKDALNGKDEIIGDLAEWKKIRKNFNTDSSVATCDKPYGALSIIKRLWDECYLKQSFSAEKYSAFNLAKASSGEASEYIAAIQMDGDKMGSILSSASKGKDFFTRFSKKLANFTRKEAKTIVEDHHKGKLIYAGGDDVLAIVPACNAVKCVQELRKKFCADEPEMPGSEKDLAPDVKRVSLSAGIAFAHWKTPLIWLLEEARDAEHRAKNEYQRDALALSIVKRGGEILQWGAKFDSPAWKLYDQFIELGKTESVSGKFASALALYLKSYQLEKAKSKDSEILSKIILADFAQVCSRQGKKDAIPQEFKDLAEEYVKELQKQNELAAAALSLMKQSPDAEDPHGRNILADFPLLFLSASFLTRKKENDKGKENA